jgi:sulfate adenylyltransferase (ADP) / ATP adenylyltransferase
MQLQFRKIPCFDEKPMPEDGKGPKGNPFAEAIEEDFVILRTDTHVLQHNKFCVYRPSLILHTKDFAPQADPLDFADFQAACQVLNELSQPYIVFYNCGVDSGSSQPHKHMQLIPKPAKEEFVLFPDLPKSNSDKENTSEPISNRSLTISQPPASSKVPFYCLISYLPTGISPKDVYNIYSEMLKSPHPDYPDLEAHNMVMTEQWICVIPRRLRLMFGVPANAMGMMGLIWCGTWSERFGWTLMGKTWHLEALGSPPLRN